MSIVESIAIQGFAGLLSNLASSYLTNKSNRLSVDPEEIKTNLKPNLSAAFEKCTRIKTILSDEIVDFLKIYSDQNFSCDEKAMDQYDVIEIVRKNSSIVITGTGGGGKSMFMRYLWLSYFEDPQGKIPFFLELRQLNRLTHSSIEDLLYHSIIQSGSKIAQSNFEKALHSGHFILFLDGFDEVNFDKRQAIEELIIRLKDNHPRLNIVVTSRPDDRFRGWHQFRIVKVQPLDKAKAIRLIERAPFDRSAIKKITKKMEEGLFETHQSFLSTPLLAYMLLVTFSYNPDIPKRMFLFYEQAFEALYHRHDLTKGGYTRKFRLDLDKQHFIKQLSYFCLTSYYDEVFEFRDETLRYYVERAKSVEGVKYDVENFIADIMESICLLKKEGLDYSFTHRSFQEYFSAYCISRVASRNIEKIFEKFAERYNDQVLVMVYDINKDLFREKYIVPMRSKYKRFYDLSKEYSIICRYFYERGARFRISFIDTNFSTGLRRPRTSRGLGTVGWHLDLLSKSNFDFFDRNIQRLAEDYYPAENEKIYSDRKADDLFAANIFKRFNGANDVFEIYSDKTKFVMDRNGK